MRVAALGLLLGLSVSVLLVVDGLALSASIAGMLATQKRLVGRGVSVCVGVVVIVVRCLFVVGPILRLEVLHAACSDDGLAESARVDVDVIEARIPRAGAAVPTLCVSRGRSRLVHSCGLTQLRRRRVLFSMLMPCVVVIVRMRVAFFGIRDLIAMSVAVSAVTVSVSMSMLVEQEEPHNVRSQAQASDDQDQLRLRDLLRLHETLNCLQEDADTQRDQEDTIHQRTQSLGALPSVCVHVRAGLGVGDLDGPETDAEGQDIVKHVEGVGDQGQRVDGISDGELEQEEDGVDNEEDDDPRGLGEGHGGAGWVMSRMLSPLTMCDLDISTSVCLSRRPASLRRGVQGSRISPIASSVTYGWY